MKISVFGTRSGTEPSDGRQQTSFAITVGERIYWFDAGECCSETASEMGLDALRVAAVFISHPHIDHTGGLVKLLWLVDKLARVRKVSPFYGEIPVFCPCDGLWGAVDGFFLADGSSVPGWFRGTRIRDGVIFDDGIVRVTALHSTHMAPRSGEGFVSFSFLIEAEGKRIIYSGDVGDFSDFSALAGSGCDLLLMETGHHDAMEVCRRASASGFYRRILFVHHHRKTVVNFSSYTSLVLSSFGSFVSFANDRDVLEI